MANLRKGLLLVPLAVVGLSVISNCVDEKIVYRDRQLFTDPLSAAGSFIGYTDESTKLTVCGNCHVEKQAGWAGTGHSHAWSDLQNSGHASAACEGCHTVNELGNVVDSVAGFNATHEDRYHDVQCESCHGPGLTHVTNPTATDAPLTPLSVGVSLDRGCGECHTGVHNPFVEEWQQSRHGDNIPASHFNFRTRDECKSCHGGPGALEAWGINTNYLEKGDTSRIGITCAICHDPHSNANEGQLRYPIDTPNVDTNLCMKCHQRRAIPDETSASSGPHSPQGPLLLGEIGTVGWTPPSLQNYDVTQIRGTHGSAANTRLCAGCHVNAYDVTDAQTGAFVIHVTGHRFLPIPCVDANGEPTEDQTCAKTAAARSFNACVGCHGDATSAASALNAAETRIADLVTQLDDLLAQVPSTEFNDNDSTYTVAEGATFNSKLGANPSSAVHNPFLTEALLRGSIQAVEDTYGVSPSPSAPAAVAAAAEGDTLKALVERWGS
jgi:predicted CXXCH cytochrome family protein